MSERSRSRLQPHKLIQLWKKNAQNRPISGFSASLGIQYSDTLENADFEAQLWKSRRSCMASAVEKKIKAENNGFWHWRLLGFAVFLQGGQT